MQPPPAPRGTPRPRFPDFQQPLQSGVTFSAERRHVAVQPSLKRGATSVEDNFVQPYGPPKKRGQSSSSVPSSSDAPMVVSSGPSWSDLFPYPSILTYLSNRGFHVPTRIQMDAIPALLAGRDVLGLSETGSGKTLAYLLPLAVLFTNKPCTLTVGQPRALILAPTRELVEQIASEVFTLFTDARGDAVESRSPVFPQHNAVALIGGTSVSTDVTCLTTRTISIIVASPGRLLQLIEKSAISLNKLEYLVLDEGDKMLDWGMEEQVRSILSSCNAAGRQTSLWSATLPTALQRLVRSSVRNPITVSVGMGSTMEGAAVAAVTQRVVYLEDDAKKPKMLVHVLRRTEAPPVLVFCNSRDSVDTVVSLLRGLEFHAAGLHGECVHGFRSKVMELFRGGRVDVLVATDVASRGIDVSEVTHVVNYDAPHSITTYYHRIGRTGRAGKDGVATTFVTPRCTIMKELRAALQEAEQIVPPELEGDEVSTPTLHDKK